MLPLQRKQAIIDFMSRHGSGSIVELSEHFDVSEMTIRRDLKLLEEEGVVQRTHGGAVYAKSQQPAEPRFEEKQGHHQELKERIAGYAVKHFVQDGGVIILEGGTTVTCMAEYLASFHNLTVITNGLNTLVTLKGHVPESTVLCCGGMLRDVSHTFVGPVAEQFFSQHHAQSVFLSASGLSLNQAFTDPNMLEGQMKQAMARAAQKRIMLLDSTKFGKVSLRTTFQLTEIEVLITDSGAPADMINVLRDTGVEVHIVEE